VVSVGRNANSNKIIFQSVNAAEEGETHQTAALTVVKEHNYTMSTMNFNLRSTPVSRHGSNLKFAMSLSNSLSLSATQQHPAACDNFGKNWERKYFL
jgi:hypothetical protein